MKTSSNRNTQEAPTTDSSSCTGETATQVNAQLQDFPLTITSNEPRIDSRRLAQQLGNKHRHVMALMDKYIDKLKTFGHVRFQNADGDRQQGGGKGERFALLNENQAYFVLSLSRNTDTVVNLKMKLIQVFSEYRRGADLRRREYLPSYQQLQVAIHAASTTSSNEGRVHMNVAKLINKTVGIETGQRASVTTGKLAQLTVAQQIATHAMRESSDHRIGYQLAKSSLEKFSDLTLNQTLPPPSTRRTG